MVYSVMLAKEYSSNMKLPKELIEDGLEPPIGWFLSEKFDGYRAIYDNIEETFVSRAQNIFNAPDWFKKAISSESFLDGELWVGRENFQEMGVVRKKNPDPKEWINVKYVVYDMPLLNKPFHKRLETLKQVVKRSQENWLKIRKTLPEPFNNLECPLIYTEQYKISSMKQFQKLYERVIKLGGEGVMIKHPESQYEDKRSNYLLKYKPNFDAEGIIMDYSPGKGKYKGMLGGFICKPLINKDTHHIIDEDENHEFCI